MRASQQTLTLRFALPHHESVKHVMKLKLKNTLNIYSDQEHVHI